MGDSRGNDPETLKLVPARSLFLRSFEIGRVDTCSNNAIDSSFTVSEWYQVRDEMTASRRKMQFIVVANRGACFQASPVIPDELPREICVEYLLDKFPPHLL